MSINVTVNGNPISIQKGRMVTASPNHSKKEFEKRRLIRLSQVRQQAKNIAEEVRNKVRKEKQKQAENLQNEGQKKLKQWQTKKLLDLQNQYHEALGEIGAGHKQAILVENDNEAILRKKEFNERVAKERGVSAGRIMKEEKVRRTVSAPLPKNKSPQKTIKKNLKPKVRHSADSMKKKEDKTPSGTDVSVIVTESDNEYDEDIREIIAGPTAIDLAFDNAKRFSGPLDDHVPLEVIKEVSIQSTASESEESKTKKSTAPPNDKQQQQNEEKMTTRISDRIKKRSTHQLDKPDLCDTLPSKRVTQKNSNNDSGACKKLFPIDDDQNYTETRQAIHACACDPKMNCCTRCHTTHSASESQLDISNHSKRIPRSDRKSTSKSRFISAPPSTPNRSDVFQQKSRREIAELPTRPKVTLKSVERPITRDPKRSEISSRLSKFLATHVERIPDESLITSPEITETDYREKFRQRDRDALIRGQKALEKEKLQREYDELIKKLPALQKLERLYKMNQDKPEYHMNEERLRELEKKKQNILDNTYERLFPDRRPPPITIPVKNFPKEKTTQNESTSLNLDLWESEKKSKKLYTEDEVEAILREGKIPSENKFRTDQLKTVLDKLKKRKEELLKEIPNLPDDPEELSKVFSHSKRTSTKISSTTTTTTDLDKESRKKSRKPSSKKIKKQVSMKIGTDTTLHSDSSYETIDEMVHKQTKSTKQTKKYAKSAQITPHKTKSKSITKVTPKKNVKIISSRVIVPKRKEISSGQSSDVIIQEKSAKTKRKNIEIPSSGQSSSDVIIHEKTPKNEPKKKKESRIHSVPSAPTNSLVSVEESSKISSTVPYINQPVINCACNRVYPHKNSSEVCEIVIKIKDHKSSEILINDKKQNIEKRKLKVEDSVDKRETHKKDETKVQKIKNAMNDECCKRKDDSAKFNSWHEKFAKNNSISTSSTSYMSPPNLPNKRETEPKAPPYFCQLMSKKPQQYNLDDLTHSPPTKLPAEKRNVFDDIKKLLAMSHLSIDELGISTVSTVTTPSVSLIDMESNRPNIDTTSRSKFSEARSDLPNFSFVSGSSDYKTNATSEFDNNSQQYPDVLEKYAKIAEKCSQRISNLSAMIEKVREEKNRMLQNPSLITSDLSTRYMDLPSPTKKIDEKDSMSSIESLSEEEKHLLAINYSLAKKLKKLDSEQIEKFSLEGSEKLEDTLEKRLKELRKPQSEKLETQQNKPEQTEDSEKGSTEYVQFLLDIPRLPPLTTETVSTKKKPPPCRSFLAARKLTEDFLKPHELSTIPEQDSQTRFESTLKEKSPQKPKENETLQRKIIPEKPETSQKIITDDNKSKSDETSLKVHRKKPNRSLNFSDNSCSSSISGDEKGEMFKIEAMLRSIGMDWAISTLRKTQEALALTSSSSSIEMKNSRELDDSEIKNYLSKQIFLKLSSSTLKSDLSPGSLNGSRDLSGIRNVDFAMKQTSTPINMSRELQKSNEKSSDLLSAVESEKGSKDFFSLQENSP